MTAWRWQSNALCSTDSNRVAFLLQEAAACLDAGGVIAYPTDTVYGLGARIDRPLAVERVLRIKGRSASRGMPVLVQGMETALALGRANAAFAALADGCWPGALTLLVNARGALSEAVAPGGKIGLRAPGHRMLLDLLDLTPTGITGTSANRSGRPALLTGPTVSEQLGADVDFILDGECLAGKSSTIVDTTTAPARIIRSGPIGEEALRAVWPDIDAGPG